MLTGVMKGSSWEGGYVFAWRFKPNKKALKLSGAKHMEIVIQFETTASFSQDPAFINSKNTNLSLSELKYINSFSPVRTTFSQSIRVKNVKIVSKF